ncbi:glycoside hydrolase family 10 protein [Flavobacterium cellulosilyticum]|uniref:Glycosyl hydrolase n=1 Tax=Flavobacterium cellulosilyticum TaxID=2541731 RepID=A0A4R5CD80_9FLAO|nr:family 10 glycosylhydrolase [Flavobacterium cellulosilyticum]TDD95102.1 glycosyl hydrolase [Flavobacterium cellulosilyticum]
MNNFRSFILLISFSILSFFNGSAQEKKANPKNEFRAIWIATVVNIDWPKNNIDSIKKQKADFIEILDTYKKLNYNAVIVQIRSVGDAFYPSKLAPWSRYLTGKEGAAPNPYFDPLEWMITQAHARGFEFHAWLNPYRATFDTKIQNLSPEHDFYKHREWMIKYGETGKEKYYYNPGLPEVQTHLIAVVDEVVKNYDVDAIHFDDYFYPYRVTGQEFNDKVSYLKYGNGLSIENWRRNNVNTFVKNVYTTIKNCKPWVQFGISPFGVWRNKSVDTKGSDTQAGQTNYDDLYADPLAWMEGKYIDYILPQLYWSIDHKTASYSKLMKWWSENSVNANIYIGNSSYKIKTDSDKRWNDPYEIPNQIDLTRTYDNIQGNAFFSAKSFVNKNLDITKLLLDNQYKYPAIPLPVPTSIRIVHDCPNMNSVSKDSTFYIFNIKNPLNTKVRYVVVYGSKKTIKIDIKDPSQIVDKIVFEGTPICIPTTKMGDMTNCALTFIDYYGNESASTIVNLPLEITKIKNKNNEYRF